jgi:1-acyl-sn-glycerol-3-phosphate acyltransferase
MRFVRNILFLLIFHSVGAVLVAIAVIASWFGQGGVIWGSRNWALWHRWCARVILGVRVQIEGTLNQGQALYVFKHESMFETIETLALFERPVVVMKQELLDMFLWGTAARKHGSIGVDRDAGAKAMRTMLTAARAAKASGRPIVLFPEGTRVPPGESPPLKAGLAGLYKILGLPVVPVALDAGKVWPHGFIKSPGIVRLRIGETIPPGLSRDEIETRVHRAINALNPPLDA